jgi:hypothetical protein
MQDSLRGITRDNGVNKKKGLSFQGWGDGSQLVFCFTALAQHTQPPYQSCMLPLFECHVFQEHDAAIATHHRLHRVTFATLPCVSGALMCTATAIMLSPLLHQAAAHNNNQLRTTYAM